MERFAIIVNGWKPWTIITKRSILVNTEKYEPEKLWIHAVYISFSKLLIQGIEMNFKGTWKTWNRWIPNLFENGFKAKTMYSFRYYFFYFQPLNEKYENSHLISF